MIELIRKAAYTLVYNEYVNQRMDELHVLSTVFLLSIISMVFFGAPIFLMNDLPDTMLISFLSTIGLVSFISMLLSLIVIGIDVYLNYIIPKATRGRSQAKWVITNFICGCSEIPDKFNWHTNGFGIGKELSEFRFGFILLMLHHFLIFSLVMPIALIIMFPIVLPIVVAVAAIIAGIFGLHYLIVMILRTVFDVKFGLEDHTKDPNAHTNTENKE